MSHMSCGICIVLHESIELEIQSVSLKYNYVSTNILAAHIFNLSSFFFFFRLWFSTGATEHVLSGGIDRSIGCLPDDCDCFDSRFWPVPIAPPLSQHKRGQITNTIICNNSTHHCDGGSESACCCSFSAAPWLSLGSNLEIQRARCCFLHKVRVCVVAHCPNVVMLFSSPALSSPLQPSWITF